MEKPLVPFTVLGLAPFDLRNGKPWSGPPMDIDSESFDRVMKSLNISVCVPMPESLHPPGDIRVHVRGLKDFHPDRLIENTPALKGLLAAGSPAGKHESGSPREAHGVGESAIERILGMVSLPEERPSSTSAAGQRPSRHDETLEQILGLVLGNPDFRNLEASWRGLRTLMRQTGSSSLLRVQIVPASLDTLEETLDTLLIELLEHLPSLILVDLPFDASPRSLELLEKIASIAETLMAPAVCSIVPKFFHLESWKDLDKIGYLPHFLDEPAYAGWRRLRRLPASHWLALACNGFLARYPYGPENPTKHRPFREEHALFASPVWALGSLILQSLRENGWPTAFTDWPRIRLEDLPATSHGKKYALSTEVLFSEDRIAQFIEAGIIPLAAVRNRDIAFTPLETTISGESHSLREQLFVSRVVRLFFWLKDRVPEGMKPAEAEEELRRGFTLAWEATGAPPPERLEISMSKPAVQGPALLSLVIRPPRQILPLGETFTLQFKW